jgi:hypothetical protein
MHCCGQGSPAICFADDKCTPPLQAADLWAYLNREEIERLSDSPDAVQSPFFQAISEQRRMLTTSTFWDAEKLALSIKRNEKRTSHGKAFRAKMKS